MRSLNLVQPTPFPAIKIHAYANVPPSVLHIWSNNDVNGQGWDFIAERCMCCDQALVSSLFAIRNINCLNFRKIKEYIVWLIVWALHNMAETHSSMKKKIIEIYIDKVL